ncbi:MAG: diacylglycerol kinase [Deltaproteobacteria bacterium]|jgi:diacylglycerol kinase (ATP)|nr:diacylglycerol kinase [Deltaproteobacteria bacterium]
MLKALLNIPKRAVSATRYSLGGLKSAFVKEEAFKLETAALVILIIVLFWANWPIWKKVALTAAYLLVPLIELINSALEDICDLISPQYNEKIKSAKDKASAAVLAAIVVSILTLIILILHP